MKNIFLGVATLSMLFGAVGCATETGEDLANEGNAVTFQVGMKSQKQTRSSEITLDWLQDGSNNIDVMAYGVGSATLTYKFALAWDASKNAWVDTNADPEFGGKPFLQPGHQLRYYATFPSYNPNEGSGTVTNPVATETDYTFDYFVQSDVENAQEDLMGASIPATMAHDLRLPFKHLLSEVNFAVKALSGINIDITGITVQNVLDKGTYSFANGWGSLGSTAAKGTYTYTPDPSEANLLKGGQHDDIRYLGNHKGNYGFNNALMLIPQEFTGSNNGSFTVTFSLTEIGSEVAVATGKTATVYFRDLDANKWEEGKRYIYVIDFSSYFASGNVTISADVDSWEDVNTVNDAAQVVQVSAPTVAAIHDAITLQSANKKANTGLARFPVHVADAIAGTLTISPTLDNFEVGNMVLIECVDEASANFIKLGPPVTSAPYWVPSYSGSVVTLTKTAAAQ
jgi:hypothetical protein